MKKIETIANSKGGIDLMVERDAGNMVRINTGNKKNSYSFWHRLFNIANGSLLEIKDNNPFCTPGK